MTKAKVENRFRLFVGVAMIVVALALSVVAASQAQAQQEPYTNRKPEVLPNLIFRDNLPPEVAPQREEILPSQETLPFTGGDVVLFVILGGAAVAVGAVILRRTRAN